MADDYPSLCLSVYCLNLLKKSISLSFSISAQQFSEAYYHHRRRRCGKVSFHWQTLTECNADSRAGGCSQWSWWWWWSSVVSSTSASPRLFIPCFCICSVCVCVCLVGLTIAFAALSPLPQCLLLGVVASCCCNLRPGYPSLSTAAASLVICPPTRQPILPTDKTYATHRLSRLVDSIL